MILSRFTLGAACLTLWLHASSILAATTADFTAIPPFLASESGKPNVIIAMDISGSMKATAYADKDGGWKSVLHNDFDPTKRYFGYFDSEKKYAYNGGHGVFHETGSLGGTGDITGTLASNEWNGNFLNWMTMRRIDVIRKVMVGGKVTDRAGETMNLTGTASSYYVLEAQNEPQDYTFRKSYSNSSQFTPSSFANGSEFLISEGRISLTTGVNTAVTALSDKFEVGRATMDWNESDDGSEPPWLNVSFENSYTKPIVVATAVSFNGGDPTVARVRNVTSTGFEIRLQEYNYRDGNHTTEDVIYMVAEEGEHSISLSGGGSLNFDAGTVNTNNTLLPSESSFSGGTSVSISGVTDPVIFAGVSSYNGSDAVHLRVHNVSDSSFSFKMQEEEAGDGHTYEDVNYIAIEQHKGAVDYSGQSVPLEIGTMSSVDESWDTLDFSVTFSDAPHFAASMQTTNDVDPANVRFANGVWSASQVDAQVSEEKSDDNERGHNNEVVGYLAAVGTSNYQIQIALNQEPIGIIQENSAAIRFGLAVYNYDQNKSPTSIYTGNTVHGGTFYPCYPDVTKATSAQSNDDICLRTDVRAPNALDNIITAIEDHPLIWGTTPIAETLYEVWGYASQGHATGGSGKPTSTPEYEDASTSSAKYPAFETSTDWDPYYYPEYSAKLECAKTFVLHFNDGAPYKDWDGSGHPSGLDEGDGDGGNLNDMLDDIAWQIRNNDCRSDLDGHQEIISYYVYAALGENESNNNSTKRMREAAANGGFIDTGVDGAGAGNHEPDPAHPSDFKAYYKTFLDGGTCDPNEWDADGDCSPDTFYYANNAESLSSELNAAFDSIKIRAASGGASAVVASSSTGDGAEYSALFQYQQTSGTDSVSWTGNIYSTFIDSSGYFREDDGDGILEATSVDGIITYCTEPESKEVRAHVASSSADIPTDAQRTVCSKAKFPKTLYTLGYVWDADNWLSGIANASIPSQRTYNDASTQKRYIFSAQDTDSNPGSNLTGWTVSNSESLNFIASNFTSSRGMALLGAADSTEASNIVNFIRGQEISGYRSRQLENDLGVTEVKRLGDVINATPVVVAEPRAFYDVIYGDSGYAAFRAKYKNRRHMVYAGSNDGMLHGFNAGWFESSTKTFKKGYSGTGQFALGQEMWAYVPYAMLPHLKYLTDPSYGNVAGNHIFGVDLEPVVFDAKVFSSDSTHPSGWGTLLVGGMRLGGGAVQVDTDGDGSADRTLSSSYFILDVTDPEQAPKLLAEISHENLGFTTSRPAPVRMGDSWYLVFGSGPDATKVGITDGSSSQAGRVFLFDLNNLSWASSFGSSGVMTLSESNSFVGSPLAMDFNTDEHTDAIYFGTAAGTVGDWSGKLHRIRIQNAADNSTYYSLASWADSVLYNTGEPMLARPTAGIDYSNNRWVYAGSGRFLTRSDASYLDTQKMFGLKEPINGGGDLTWASTSGLVDVTSAVVKSTDASLSGVSHSDLDGTPTQPELENIITSKYTVGGWQKSLSSNAGERVLGRATLIGGAVAFTTFAPSSLTCEFGGDARLYAVDYITGTASDRAILGTEGTGSDEVNAVSIELGDSLVTRVNAHLGDDYDKRHDADDISSDHDQTRVGLASSDSAGNKKNTDVVVDALSNTGEMSWKRLYPKL